MEISKFEAKSMFGLANTSIQNLCFLHILHRQGGTFAPLHIYVMYGKVSTLDTYNYQAKHAFGFKL